MSAISPRSITTPPLSTNNVRLIIEDTFANFIAATFFPDSRPSGPFPKVYTFTLPDTFIKRLAVCDQCRWRSYRWVVSAGGAPVLEGTITGSGPLPCRDCTNRDTSAGDSQGDDPSDGGIEPSTGRAAAGSGGFSDSLTPPPVPPAQNPCLPPPAVFPATPTVPTPCT